jgi:hypothetical protein
MFLSSDSPDSSSPNPPVMPPVAGGGGGIPVEATADPPNYTPADAGNQPLNYTPAEALPTPLANVTDVQVETPTPIDAGATTPKSAPYAGTPDAYSKSSDSSPTYYPNPNGGVSTTPPPYSQYAPSNPPTPYQNTAPSPAPIGGTNPTTASATNQDTAGGPSLAPSIAPPSTNAPPAASAPASATEYYETNGPQMDSIAGPNVKAEASQNAAPPTALDPIGGVQTVTVTIPPIEAATPPPSPSPPSSPIGGTTANAGGTPNQDTGGGISLQPTSPSPPPDTTELVKAISQINSDMPVLERFELASVLVDSTGALVTTTAPVLAETHLIGHLTVEAAFDFAELLGPILAYAAAVTGWVESGDPSKQISETVIAMQRAGISFTLDEYGMPSVAR